MSGGMQVVDFDPKTNKFVVSCPLWLVEKCRAIPNRRWNKTNKTWIAPRLARNIQYLETAFADAIWTDGAKLAAAEYKDSRRISRLPFPSWDVFKREPRAQQPQAI